LFLRYYILQAKWTRIPVIGRMVRKVANRYGKRLSGAYVLTPDEANRIVDSSEWLALGPCACRAVFGNCDSPVNTEIMLGFSRNIFVEERPHDYREITKLEAREILEQCHQRGLIHTIVKCRQAFYAMCNCCSCCCVPLRLSKLYGIGNALTRNDDIIQQFQDSRSPSSSPM